MSVNRSCVLVDDDEIDRLTTQSFVSRVAWLELKGVFSGSAAAVAAMDDLQPDILFLDVDMPGLTGLDIRARFLHIPACVFITSYPDYAVEAFDNDAIDFLVKPIRAARFEQMLQRLLTFFELKDKAAEWSAQLGGDAVYLKEGNERVKLWKHDILYLEAFKDYTAVHTRERKHMILSPLSQLLAQEEFRHFLRIHRSYAVPKTAISRIGTNEVEIGAIVLPIGRAFRQNLVNL